jgi:hypothetical protein
MARFYVQVQNALAGRGDVHRTPLNHEGHDNHEGQTEIQEKSRRALRALRG